MTVTRDHILIALGLAGVIGCRASRPERSVAMPAPIHDSAPVASASPETPSRLGSGSLDGLIVPRTSRIVHYSSYDPNQRNDDFRRLAPGDTLTLMDHRGPGIVRRWWITIAPRNHTAIQRQLIIRAYWDDETEPSVEVPVSDFFGMGFGEWRDFISAPLNMTSGGYNSYWPMPFKRRGRIVVENRSPAVIDRFYYNVDVEAFNRLPEEVLYFHAQFRRTTTVRGRPVTVLEARGRGHYAGTLLSMQPLGRRSLWYLEGNERVFVDGDTMPTVLGTGTEDYFSSGWYFDTGPYSAPYHGATIKDSASGRINAYRWHVEDPIPFTHQIQFTIEHGATNDAPDTDYSSVAYWYQTHPHLPFPPLPTNLMPTPALQPYRIQGLIEAESLRTSAEVTAGRVEVQDLGGFETDSTRWSQGLQLWWVESRPGARLALPLRIASPGSYELIGYFTRGPDYGNIRVAMNGRPLPGAVQGYSPTVTPSGPISLGRTRMRAGVNTLAVEIVGKDVRSQGYSEGYLVGLDGFLLRR